MKFHTLLITAVVSAGLAGLAGCNRDQPPRQAAPAPSSTAPISPGDRAAAPTPPATTPGSTAPISPGDRAAAPTPPAMTPGDSQRSAGQTLDDAGITAKVKAALLAEKDVNGTSINVDTMEGRVTLSGKVPDPGQVDRAAQVAGSIEGVKGVDNKLTAGS